MASPYQITNTEGTDVIVVQPQSVDITSSDLILSGMGRSNWGEGVNENVYRLMESFACPEKIGLPAGVHVPQDTSDLGVSNEIANGINNPTRGQLWFNTTVGELFVCKDPAAMPYPDWDRSANGFLPLDGSVAMTGNLDMGGNSIINLNVAPPTNPSDVATKQYVDDEIADLTSGLTSGVLLDSRYVNLTGDTMTGDLNVGSNQVNLTGIQIGVGAGNVNTGPDIQISDQGLLSADSNFFIHVDANNDANGHFEVAKGAYDISGSTPLFRIDNTGRIRSMLASYEAVVDIDAALVNRRYVRDNFARLDSNSTKSGGHWTLNDGVILRFGTGNDASLFHNGSDLFLDMDNNDDLFIRDVNSGSATRFTFDVSSGGFTASGNVTAYSDIRLKTDIERIPNALNKVSNIVGVTYKRTDLDDGRRHVGVIAQDVLEVLPEAVFEREDTLSVAYGNMVGLLVEAIKELKQEIEELKNKS